MEGISATVNSMGQNSGLLSSLTDWNSTLAGYADSISTGVVMPVALTLLALFMILELYNATQRIAMNGSNNAFTIQQIALVMLKIVVCRWAVVHTTEILNALFEVASTVTVGISGYVGSGEVNTTIDIENAIAALPGGIGNMPVALELMVVGWMLRIVNIVVNTIVAARFIELYVYNAMASLSIATLCYQELHGIAVNFLKSYLAVALQGAVLYLVIGFYPALAGSLGTGGSITEQAWAMLGQSVILLVAVFMSGKFTKAIAIKANEMGCATIALTSVEYSSHLTSKHPSGKRLFEACTYCIDNCTNYGDTLVDVPALGQGICPASGISASYLMWALQSTVVEKLLAKGLKPSVYISNHMPNAPKINGEALERYNEFGY